MRTPKSQDGLSQPGWSVPNMVCPTCDGLSHTRSGPLESGLAQLQWPIPIEACPIYNGLSHPLAIESGLSHLSFPLPLLVPPPLSVRISFHPTLPPTPQFLRFIYQHILIQAGTMQIEQSRKLEPLSSDDGPCISSLSFKIRIPVDVNVDIRGRTPFLRHSTVILPSTGKMSERAGRSTPRNARRIPQEEQGHHGKSRMVNTMRPTHSLDQESVRIIQ